MPDISKKQLIETNQRLKRRCQQAEAALDEQIRHPNSKQNQTILTYYLRALDAEAELYRVRDASEESIHDLLATQTRLEKIIGQIVVAADKLCNMKSAMWMDEALQAADDLQQLLWAWRHSS